MTKPLYTMSHPKVTAARAKFFKTKREQKTMKRCTLSFEKLCTLYQDPAVSFAEIKRQTGLHASTVTRLFEDIFIEICEPRLGRERYEDQVARTTAKKKERLAKQLPDKEAFRAITEQARTCKHTVEACIASDRLVVSKVKVMISGTRCLIHPITKANRPNENVRLKYGIALIHRLKLNEDPFHLFPILVNGTRDIYVIPSSVLKALFLDSEKRQERLYIPLHAEGIGSKRSEARIDLRPYRNAWHLIPYR